MHCLYTTPNLLNLVSNLFPLQEEFVGLEDVLRTWTSNCPPKEIEVSIEEHPEFLAKFNSFNSMKQFSDVECHRLPVPTEEHNNVNLVVLDMR